METIPKLCFPLPACVKLITEAKYDSHPEVTINTCDILNPASHLPTESSDLVHLCSETISPNKTIWAAFSH